MRIGDDFFVAAWGCCGDWSEGLGCREGAFGEREAARHKKRLTGETERRREATKAA